MIGIIHNTEIKSISATCFVLRGKSHSNFVGNMNIVKVRGSDDMFGNVLFSGGNLAIETRTNPERLRVFNN